MINKSRTSNTEDDIQLNMDEVVEISEFAIEEYKRLTQIRIKEEVTEVVNCAIKKHEIELLKKLKDQSTPNQTLQYFNTIAIFSTILGVNVWGIIFADKSVWISLIIITQLIILHISIYFLYKKLLKAEIHEKLFLIILIVILFLVIGITWGALFPTNIVG